MEDAIAARDAEIAELHAVVDEQAVLIEELRAEIAELKARLGQNSSNSSKPPSSDGYAKPTRQQRRDAERKARKAGKQPGAEGSNLARVDDPDEVITHDPDCCHDRGESLDDADLIDEEVRQVFDLPERKVVVREHRARKRRCRCGKTTKASFPPEAINVTCYGPRVRALSVYLVCGHAVGSGLRGKPETSTAQAVKGLQPSGLAYESCIGASASPDSPQVRQFLGELAAAGPGQHHEIG